MANNTIGWGQGATNNNIGWGRGSTNDIGWGSVYENSYVGDTDIIGGDTRFIFTIKTDNSGVSASNQFQLPLVSSGTINFDVDWGDGTTSNISAYNDTDALHTFPSIGTYEIKITGEVKGWRFNAGGDRFKMLNIANWGEFNVNVDLGFYGCTNLTQTATDSPTITSVSLYQYFGFCANFNGDLSGWDVSSVTNFQGMFRDMNNFNSDISNWNVSSALNMSYMLQNADSFDKDLSNWDINQVTNFTGFMVSSTGLSTTNYDNTLISWAAQTPQNNIVINFGTAKYSNAAAAARELLTRAVVDGGYGWTITDGGGVDLLDTYTGAAAAYSLRTIKSSTTKVVRVRADVVGQPEQDFTAAQITDGTLATFVGAGNNGYVVTWYDQSGSGNHATQGTAANQPQIVASGVVNLVNGMPAILSDGVDDSLSLAFSATNPTTQFFVYDKVGTSNYLGGLFATGNSAGAILMSSTGVYAYQTGPQFTPTYANNNQAVVSLKSSTIGTDWAMWGNGTSITNSGEVIGTFAPNNITLMSRGNLTQFGNTYFQEYIVYPSDQTSNQSAIESNINDYYNIYP